MVVFGPHQALGTTWYIECFEAVDQATVATVVSQTLEDFESVFSRFRPDSVLSQLNQAGVLTAPDPLVRDVLLKALQYFRDTNGVFNIAIGEKLSGLGYDAEYSFVATEQSAEIPALPEVLEVSQEKIILHKGSFDIGGFGKGYAIDLLATVLRQELGLQQFLINGGGDMHATSEAGKAVTIALAHPVEAEQSIGSVALQDCGFAASSPYVRSWPSRNGGTSHNHLMSDSGVSSFVVAPTAVEADVWATTLAIQPEIDRPETVQCLLVKGEKIIAADDVFKLNA